jgi:hypothetical protein
MEKKDDPEPVERLEEMTVHPADKTYHTIHNRGLSAKKELADDRRELGLLLNQLSTNPPPAKGSREHAAYLRMQKEIETLKVKVSEKHDQLMEILKHEERIGREIQEKNKP